MTNTPLEVPEGSLFTGRIEIVLFIDQNGTPQQGFEARDANGDMLNLVETLGQMRLAEDSAIRWAMNNVPDAPDIPPIESIEGAGEPIPDDLPQVEGSSEPNDDGN